MEKPPINSVNQIKLPKTEQLLENFSLSEQEKNIRETFKLNPDLLKEVRRAVGESDDYKDITIELGRNKDVKNLGKVQNIKVYYKGELIINSDEETTSDKLYLVTKDDGISYVGNVFIPTELQGKGLYQKILQKVSDALNTKIVPSYLVGDNFTSENAKKMWNKIGNEILPNREEEKLYAKYLETIFPESKVKNIVWHYSDGGFKNESFKPMKPDFNTLNSIDGVYNFSTNQNFVKRYGKNPYAVILNIVNPLATTNSGEYVDDLDRPLSEALYKIGKQKEQNFLAPQYDENLKNTDAVINNITGKEYVERHSVSGLEIGLPKQTLISVFSPSQIHILGSKSDIEKFKEFIEIKYSKKD